MMTQKLEFLFIGEYFQSLLFIQNGCYFIYTSYMVNVFIYFLQKKRFWTDWQGENPVPEVVDFMKKNYGKIYLSMGFNQ